MMPERFLWGTGNGSSKGPKSEEFQFQTRLVQVSMLALAFRRILFQLISVGKPMWHQWQPVFLSVLACKALCKVMMVSKRALRPEFIMLDRWVADDGQVCFMTTLYYIYIYYIYYIYICVRVSLIQSIYYLEYLKHLKASILWFSSINVPCQSANVWIRMQTATQRGLYTDNSLGNRRRFGSCLA